MFSMKICNWLMDHADAPIRYRVAREILSDESATKGVEAELLEHSAVGLWLKNLTSADPMQHHATSMAHGSMDSCLENALYKCTRLGLHGGLQPLIDATEYYIATLKNNVGRPYRDDFNKIVTAGLFAMAGIEDEVFLACKLGLLDEMYYFAKQNRYDIYISEEERAGLAGVPLNWRSREDFIKKDLASKFGTWCPFPLIYDIMGLYGLYGLGEEGINQKINTVLSYISNDNFHSKITDGYGITISNESHITGKSDYGKNLYRGMGWSPHYPGWFDVPDYIANAVVSVGHTRKPYVPRLLFFAEVVSHYPVAVKTRWFSKLLAHLENYKTEAGTYLFPKEWLPEKTGYAVCGFHMSYGENRRKKNWCEIESTFYMLLLQQNLQRLNHIMKDNLLL